ncbi:MAG: hypothetical protein HYV96_09025 [Opitutae bacterium]|nr:hypothetical protein [Opitutae bacterium]
MKTFLASLVLLFSVARAGATDGGFLFVMFRNEPPATAEQIHFALSRDGREWTALNDGRPVLVTELGEKGARDPYVLRREDGQGFVLIATAAPSAR